MKIVNDIIQTQIGNIGFHFQASSGDISDASIIISELESILPDGMEVENNVAALLTVKSPIDITELKFSCIWQGELPKGSMRSGEALDAWEWEANGQLVIIGTEDGDWLSSRLNLGQITQNNYPVTELGNCITIEISRYPANKELTLHFVVASNSLPEKQDCSCWFAVDVPHERIIKSCRQS